MQTVTSLLYSVAIQQRYNSSTQGRLQQPCSRSRVSVAVKVLIISCIQYCRCQF